MRFSNNKNILAFTTKANLLFWLDLKVAHQISGLRKLFMIFNNYLLRLKNNKSILSLRILQVFLTFFQISGLLSWNLVSFSGI